MARATIDDLLAADRVMCSGVTGSGKTTLATRLAASLDLPLTLVDEIGWLPGWQKREHDETRAALLEVAAGERWMLDSVWGGHLAAVLPRVQLVVGLDYPRPLSFARLLRRTLTRVVRREEMLNGNVETLRRMLSRDSILVWHVTSWRKNRRRIRDWEADPGGVPVLRLRSPRQADALLEDLQRRG